MNRARKAKIDRTDFFQGKGKQEKGKWYKLIEENKIRNEPRRQALKGVFNACASAVTYRADKLK